MSWLQPLSVCRVLSLMVYSLRPPQLCWWPVPLHSRDCCVMVPRAGAGLLSPRSCHGGCGMHC